MTPEDLVRIGQKLYGRKGWRSKLAADLGVDPVTVWRLVKSGKEIPGPYDVAIVGMLNQRTAQLELEKRDRKIFRQSRRLKK